MTSAEYRRWHREQERRRALNAELVASKRKREEAARRERQAREAEAFAIKHGLAPERIYQRQPEVTLAAGFGGLRPGPSPQERARQSRRADEILEAYGVHPRRSKTSRGRVVRTSEPERIVRTFGAILDVSLSRCGSLGSASGRGSDGVTVGSVTSRKWSHGGRPPAGGTP